MNPQHGTQRWEKLCDLLLATAESSTDSKRTRLTAAMRLADLLEVKAKADIAEAARQDRRERAAEAQRDAAIATAKVTPVAPPQAEEPGDANDRRIAGVFAEILNRPIPLRT